jgi:mannose-6-phosphate isomerase-like protein (cupin superfamily)
MARAVSRKPALVPGGWSVASLPDHRREAEKQLGTSRSRSASCTRRVRSRAVGYAKKNLRDVQDMAVQFGFSKTQEARFAGQDLGAEQTGMNYLIIKPGQREAFAHRHRTAEEIYVVLSGSGRVKLDEELVELAPLDAVRVSPGVTRSFEAGRDGLQVLIFGPHVEGDGEMVHDFWDE